MPLIPKQLDTNDCVPSTEVVDTLLLQHQAISIHRADNIFFVLDQFIPKYYIYS